MKRKKTTSITRGGIEIRTIIVVDCISSGTNYIEDIVNRGYKPVVLELQPGGADPEEYIELPQLMEVEDSYFTGCIL